MESGFSCGNNTLWHFTVRLERRFVVLDTARAIAAVKGLWSYYSTHTFPVTEAYLAEPVIEKNVQKCRCSSYLAVALLQPYLKLSINISINMGRSDKSSAVGTQRHDPLGIQLRTDTSGLLSAPGRRPNKKHKRMAKEDEVSKTCPV